MIEPTVEGKAQGKPKASSEREARELEARRERVREQFDLLTSASFCTIAHAPRLGRVNVPSQALARNMMTGMRVEGDDKCPECAKRLPPVAAALVLVLLPPTPTDKLHAAARTLQSTQPMTWAAVLRGHYMQLEQAQKRMGKTEFTWSHYQAMASEILGLVAGPPSVAAAAAG
jgi:hypothetical protein